MKKPLHLAGLDSEDDSKGAPLLFALVHQRGQTWARERHVMLERMARLAEKAGGLEVWCTNLEYDLLNLFGEERIAELALRFGKSYLVGARWRGRKVEFRDTVRHVPVSVETLGELIGKRKVERDLFHDRGAVTEEKLARRCLRDAAITYQTARKLRELYAEVGGRARMTLASSAYNVWAERFWRKPVHRPTHEHWAAAFEAYYGGRTEPFAVGDFVDVSACDAASMFPWAMVADDFPLPWGPWRRHLPGVDRLDDCGFYRARVTSDLPVPLLPYRSDSGLIFPNGSWVGWYVGHELLEFIRLGGKARVLEGFSFVHRVRPFDAYIGTMFKKKNRSKGARKLFYKLMLNALYGKFGQRGERVIAATLEEFARLPKAPAKYRIWAGLALYSEKRNPPPWGNNVWPAIVTARARVRLHREIERLRSSGARILYCDTDGILYQGGSVRYPLKVKTPGEFESRGEFPSAIIRAKKEYGLQSADRTWRFFVKGVPPHQREKYIQTGEVEFERPVKLRESARSGETPNVWRSVRKVRRVNFDSRNPKRDGTLAPIIVDGE